MYSIYIMLNLYQPCLLYNNMWPEISGLAIITSLCVCTGFNRVQSRNKADHRDTEAGVHVRLACKHLYQRQTQ